MIDLWVRMIMQVLGEVPHGKAQSTLHVLEVLSHHAPYLMPSRA